MADSNVVNPNTNNQQPTAVQSLLAGLNQPGPQMQAPQVPQMSPIQANTSKWAGIVQGAFAGLAGGIKAGVANMNAAGTGRPLESGFDAGQQQLQMQQQQEQQKQQAAQAASQQNFENQMAAGKYSQEQILNRARLAESNLNALKLAQSIDNAPKEAQDAYYKENDAHANDLRNQGMSELTSVPDLNSLGQYMKQSGKTAMDVVTTHHRDENGNDQINVWDNPDHEVDTDTINRGLKANNQPPVPPGTTMNYKDYKSLLGQAHSKYADELNKQADEARKEQFERSQTAYVQNREDDRENMKINKGQSATDQAALLESAADRIHQGKLTFEQATKGMGKEAADFARQLNYKIAQKYPDDNVEALKAYSRQAENPQTQNQLAQARTLFGRNGQPGTFDTVQDLMQKIPTGAHWYSQYTQKAAYETGQQSISQLKRIAPEVANDLAQFQTGAGGRQTDARVDNALSQIDSADTRENIEAGFNTLRQVAEERMHGIVGPNPYLREMAKDINPPSQGAQEQPVVVNGKITGYTRDGKTYSRLAQ